MIIGEKPPSNIIKSCDRKGVNLTKKITVYKPLSELEQVCRLPLKKKHSSRSSSRSHSPPRKIRKKSSSVKKKPPPKKSPSSPKKLPAKKSPSVPKKLPAKKFSEWLPIDKLPRRKIRRSRIKKIIVRKNDEKVAKSPSFFKRVRSSMSSSIKNIARRISSGSPFLLSRKGGLRPAPRDRSTRRKNRFWKNRITKMLAPALVTAEAQWLRDNLPRRSFKKSNRTRSVESSPLRPAPRDRTVSTRPKLRSVPSIYSPYSEKLKKPYSDFSNKVRAIRSPQDIMVPREPIEFRRMVFLQKIPDHLGENVAALKQRMADMEHIQRLLEAQLIKCRKSRTPERAVNNNQLVKIERRIGELRNEEDQYNKYVQLMQEFISKYNQTKQEEQVKIDRLRYEIHDILKKVSSAFELQSQLFDTQEKILTKITNSSQTSKAELREWAKNIEKVANEKDRLIEALVPATLKLQQVPDETNAQLKEAIRELQKIYDKQGTMFGQMPYYPQQYQQSYPQPSELTQVLKNSERESLQKQFERLTDLVLKQQQQAPSAFFQQQQQQQQAPAAVVPANDGVTKAELNDLKSMISNLTRMVLEKPAERKSEPAKWDLPETSSANVRKMQELQRNRDDLLITGRGGDYENQRDVLASILAEEQKKPDPKLAMFEKLLGGKGGGDSSALLDFIIKMKLLKGLGFDISDIFGGTTAISNNTNTNTITGAATQTTDEKFMAKLDEIISILKSHNTMQTAHEVQEATPAHNNHTIDDVYKSIKTIIDKLRGGDYKGANDILENLKSSINTQNNKCDELAPKLDEISEKLNSVSDGNISNQVSDMNLRITKLTNEIKKLSTDRTSSDTTELLESKKKELVDLQEKNSDLKEKIDVYEAQLKQIKEVLGLIPNCDGLGIIAALKKFKEEMEKRGGKPPQSDASVGTEDPSWYDSIKDVVKRVFKLNLDLDNDRVRFITFLETGEKILIENEIDSLEKLEAFIAEIKNNKKCCDELQTLRAEITELNDQITELSKGTNNAEIAEGEIDRLNAEIERLKDGLKKHSGDANNAKKAEQEIKRLEEKLAAAEAALEEAQKAEAAAREKAEKAEALAAAAREEAEKAERKAKEEEERKAREAADKAAAAAADAAKKPDDPKLKKRREFLLEISTKRTTVEHNNRLFKRNNGITVSSKDEKNILYTIPSNIVDTVKDVKDMLAKDVNDLYEIINGIGLVVVRIGGPDIPNGEDLAYVENDYIKLNKNCDNKEEYGPFLAFGPSDKQETIYKNEQLTDFFKYENDIALFSYGASGSGKTYTLFGNKFLKGEDEGIIHKIMNDKFIKKSKITATAIQWYCGNIYSAYIENKRTYKYELGNSNDTNPGVEVLNAPTNDWLDIKKYNKDSSMRLLTNLDDYFKNFQGIYNELFYKYIRDRGGDNTKTKNFKNEFRDYFFDKDTNDFIKLDDEKKTKDRKNLFGKILDNLKTFNVSRNDKSFASFNNKKQPTNNGDKLLDGHLIDSKDNPFDTAVAKQITIENADGLNKYLTQVMKSRPTRATAKNPDSSRSHLFIRFQVTTTGKTQNIYTCDLGGIEEPLEYFDLAMLEGYWVVLGIKQIGEIIESYNNYKLPVENDIQNDLKNYLYPTRELPSSDSTTELSFDLQNIKLDNKPIIKKVYFDKLFQIMKYVIGEEKLTNFLKEKDTSALTKIVSFVNVKKQIKKEIDDLARDNACTAAKDSLKFAEKLLKITTHEGSSKFGRIARRRSYARKGAATLEGTRAKRRSFKRPKRLPSAVAPAIGVATNKARKRSYRRIGRAVATSQESGLSKLRRRSIRRVRRKRS